MPDDPKTARAAELQKAIEAHDAKKRDDADIDLAKERGEGSSGQHLDKMLSHLDDCMKRLDAFGARMDEWERHKDDARKKRDDDTHKKRDDESEEEYEARMKHEGRTGLGERGEAKEVVADSTAPQTRYALLGAQAAAEKAYEVWGLHAPAPLYGEKLRDFRIRLLRPLQKHSKQYSKSDLETLPRDEAVFGAVERTVYADSIAKALRLTACRAEP